MLYGLDGAGLDPGQLTAASAYRSSGATCEEVCLLTFSDEAAAQTAVSALNTYVSTQILANKSYRPAQIPKLEQTVLEQRGTSVLLLVADNYQAASKLLAP